jgi:two-component system, NtrC family, response regulator AtoC
VALCRSCEAVVRKPRRLSYTRDLEMLREMKWVLIVEDHALFREGLALLLKWRTGLDSVQSDSIAETRRILGEAKEDPVCAVVDLDLPDGDAIDLVERLRGLPVVALVSDRSLERRVRALEAGADEVLHKGTSGEKIQRTVAQLVGGLRTRDFYSG